MKPLYVKKNGVVYKISGTGIPSIYPAANVEYDNTVTSELQATDVQGAIDELSTRQDTNTKNTAYGTCDTAGNAKDKVVTLVNATNWSLEVGTIVGVRFTYTNTYTPSSGNNVTLNVNNTGAKNIRYSDGIVTSSTSDAKCPIAYGEAGQTIYYMYDGTYWVWVSHSKDNDTLYNFKGNEFRSADGNNYGLETGYGGNANYMVVNGHYYYNSNGPSTDIGASANDGAIYVQAYDEDNVTQIAQNYETGNLFVRSKVNGSWTEWKKPIANITGNNTVLTTDKTPYLNRQCLTPTGFSGYVREKLIGASYAWNQLVQNGNFADTSGWQTSQCSISASSNILTATHSQNTVAGASFYKSFAFINGHKYYFCMTAKQVSANSTNPSKVLNISLSRIGASNYLISNVSLDTWYKVECIAESTVSSTQIIEFSVCSRASATGSCQGQAKEVQIIDLTLAFGSTIADYLYGLSNNGGITKLRDMGCPIDKYTPYGYGLYSVKPSGKKIVWKNLCEDVIVNCAIDSSGLIYASTGTKMGVARVLQGKTYVVKSDDNTLIAGLFYTKPTVGSTTYSGTRIVGASGDYSFTSPITGWIAFRSTSSYQYLQCEFGSTSTTYEPYCGYEISLGDDELRGKFDLVNGEIVASGDVKESNGEITRNYLSDFDLGSLNWQTFGSSYPNIFYAEITDGILSSNSTGRDTGSCAKYVVVAKDITAIGDKECTFGSRNVFNNRGSIMLKDTAYSDAATLKTSLSGSYATCEKATPTTEQSTPFADPMSMVGATTEEYIDTRDIPCPVGAERQYMGQSEDVVEIPSSPLSDGKRVLISEVSGGKEQVYWDIPKLYYKEYTVQGDGTKTYGDLLAELKPYYETLSEDEKTYSKVMMRATSSGNECLTFVGNYWYSRMGVNASGLWLDQIDFQYNKYFKQVSGGSITEETNTITHNVIALRVLTYTRAEP